MLPNGDWGIELLKVKLSITIENALVDQNNYLLNGIFIVPKLYLQYFVLFA